MSWTEQYADGGVYGTGYYQQLPYGVAPMVDQTVSAATYTGITPSAASFSDTSVSSSTYSTITPSSNTWTEQ